MAMKEFRVTQIPQSMVAFHRLTTMGYAERLLPSPTKLMVRHGITEGDRTLYAAMLKDAELLWMIYEKGAPDAEEMR